MTYGYQYTVGIKTVRQHHPLIILLTFVNNTDNNKPKVQLQIHFPQFFCMELYVVATQTIGRLSVLHSACFTMNQCIPHHNSLNACSQIQPSAFSIQDAP